MSQSATKKVNGVVVVNESVRAALEEKQLIDYTSYKIEFVQWLSTIGKNPQKAKGYASATVRQTSQQADRIYLWLWDRDGYTTNIDPTDATEFINYLLCNEEEYTDSFLASTQTRLKRIFKWRRHARGRNERWNAPYSFSPSTTNARDYLTIEERRKVREAALEYGSIPHYHNVTPEERDRWKSHLAQRFEKPKSEVSPQDWDRANGWKVTSLTWTSLDAGLRPVEVERATIEWVDVENRVLRIPKEESSKNRDNWIVSITDRTAEALDRWTSEREMYDAYTDTDALWLTRKENPYGSNSLSYLLNRLCEIAEIPTDNRQLSWYAIRHSVGTYMTREEDLAAAQAQLRHKSPETTMRYDQAAPEDRRNALNKMG